MANGFTHLFNKSNLRNQSSVIILINMKHQKLLVLGHTENYNCQDQIIWSFHKVTDVVEGIELRLSNMAGGNQY